jgi:hypothetical protein
MPAEPFVSQSLLQFRGIPDSLANLHLEGLECCLIHVDNPLRDKKQTFVNPQVLVGYSGDVYSAVRLHQSLLSSWQITKALWENRIRRWTTSPCLKDWVIRNRVKRWKTISKDDNKLGTLCLVNEMQILANNG